MMPDLLIKPFGDGGENITDKNGDYNAQWYPIDEGYAVLFARRLGGYWEMQWIGRTWDADKARDVAMKWASDGIEPVRIYLRSPDQPLGPYHINESHEVLNA